MALLGVDSRSTYYELIKRARETKEVKGLSKDQLDRLSYLLGIYGAIRVPTARKAGTSGSLGRTPPPCSVGERPWRSCNPV